MMIPSEMASTFEFIMQSLRAYPEDEVETLRELTGANEWEVAFEVMCTQIYEYDIRISREVMGAIEKLDEALSVDEKHADLIRRELLTE